MKTMLLLVVLLLAGACSAERLAVPAGVEVVPHRLIAEDLPEGDGRPLTSFVTSVEMLAPLETSAFDQVVEMVDFESEFVVIFDLSESSSCRLEPLQAVLFAETEGMQPLIATGGGDGACSADDNPHRIIVAIEWADLPDDMLIDRASGRPSGR